MMRRFYYAHVDGNGVLCVDQLDPENGPWTEESMASMAETFPETIYFHYWAGDR